MLRQHSVQARMNRPAGNNSVATCTHSSSSALSRTCTDDKIMSQDGWTSLILSGQSLLYQLFILKTGTKLTLLYSHASCYYTNEDFLKFSTNSSCTLQLLAAGISRVQNRPGYRTTELPLILQHMAVGFYMNVAVQAGQWSSA